MTKTEELLWHLRAIVHAGVSDEYHLPRDAVKLLVEHIDALEASHAKVEGVWAYLKMRSEWPPPRWHVLERLHDALQREPDLVPAEFTGPKWHGVVGTFKTRRCYCGWKPERYAPDQDRLLRLHVSQAMKQVKEDSE